MFEKFKDWLDIALFTLMYFAEATFWFIVFLLGAIFLLEHA